jgi:transcriptional regulator with XRE-family HTH domain
MLIGHRWRELREQAKVSQSEMARRTGLLPSHISDLEHGRTVPSMGTFEKVARALQVPVDRLFYDGENPPELVSLPKRKAARRIASDRSGQAIRWTAKLRRLLNRSDKKLVPSSMIRKMVTAQGRLKD